MSETPAGGPVSAKLRQLEQMIRVTEMVGLWAYEEWAKRRKETPMLVGRRHCRQARRVVCWAEEWDVICEWVEIYVSERGAQTALARALHVPRQRVHEYFRSGRAVPNAKTAERVLQWLAKEHQRRLAQGGVIDLRRPLALGLARRERARRRS